MEEEIEMEKDEADPFPDMKGEQNSISMDEVADGERQREAEVEGRRMEDEKG